MKASAKPQLASTLVVVTSLVATAGCTATMDNSFRSSLLTPVSPRDFAKTPQDVYPISAETLAKARAKPAPLICDARGPAGDAAKKVLAAIPKAIARLKKDDSPCARGEAKGSADASGANLCWNTTTKETTSRVLVVSCDGGKVAVTIDQGTFTLEKLYGTIYAYKGSATLTLLGWDAAERRAVVVRSSLDHPERSPTLGGSFLVLELPYVPAASREMIPTIVDFDDWELFMVDGEREGYVVHAPRDLLLGPAEIEAAAFQVQ